MNKKIFTILLPILVFLLIGATWVQDDIVKAPVCRNCGLDRTLFAQHRLFVTYEDGSSSGICSMHCLALDLVINGNAIPVAIEAADYRSKRLIDAETAFWVMGGNLPEIMSKQAKWAFAKKEYADKFIREHGGTAMTFEEVIQATYANMYDDLPYVRQERRQKIQSLRNKSQ